MHQCGQESIVKWWRQKAEQLDKGGGRGGDLLHRRPEVDLQMMADALNYHHCLYIMEKANRPNCLVYQRDGQNMIQHDCRYLDQIANGTDLIWYRRQNLSKASGEIKAASQIKNRPPVPTQKSVAQAISLPSGYSFLIKQVMCNNCCMPILIL